MLVQATRLSVLLLPASLLAQPEIKYALAQSLCDEDQTLSIGMKASTRYVQVRSAVFSISDRDFCMP